jgi:hypothetical protein
MLNTEHFPVFLSGRLISVEREAAATWYGSAVTGLSQGAKATGSFISETAKKSIKAVGLASEDESGPPEEKAPEEGPGPAPEKVLVFKLEQIRTANSCFTLNDSRDKLTVCGRE